MRERDRDREYHSDTEMVIVVFPAPMNDEIKMKRNKNLWVKIICQCTAVLQYFVINTNLQGERIYYPTSCP
jgi:hypothetical protein